MTSTCPPLSRDWRSRRALSVPSWDYHNLKDALAPDPQTRKHPAWIAEAEIVGAGPAARRLAESWLSVVTLKSLPLTWAALQTAGDVRLVDRVAVAWLLKEGLRLPESLRAIVALVGADVPEMASEELIDGAALVLWSKARALPEARRGELREAFSSWAGFAEAEAAAVTEWEAYLYPEGRRAPGGAL